MANTKEIQIEALVPYDWASNLVGDEPRIFAAYFLAPSGFKLTYQPGSSSIPLPNGGRLTMLRIAITGQEACWHDTLDIIVQALKRQDHAYVSKARVRDLDAPSGWEPI